MERQWTWERGWKTPLGTNSTYTRIGADPGDAEERRATKPRAARLGRAPQDHRGVLAMLNTATRAQKGKKENSGRLNERVTEIIKAGAWRNKSKIERNKSKRWRKDKDQTQEINQNGKIKPGLD